MTVTATFFGVDAKSLSATGGRFVTLTVINPALVPPTLSAIV